MGPTMANGFIKLHRKLMQWEWYDDPNTLRVFLHILLNANHAVGKWRGVEIQPGQWVTGSESLGNALMLSRQQIRTSLSKLKSTSEITIKTTNKFSIITLLNWGKYQVEAAAATNKTTSLFTSQQPTNNQQVTTNKKKKNNKKEKKPITTSFSKPTLEEMRAYAEGVNLKVDCEACFDFYESNGWMVGKNSMKDWKPALRGWARRSYDDKRTGKPGREGSSNRGGNNRPEDFLEF